MVKISVSKFKNAIPKHPSAQDLISEINATSPNSSLYGDLISSSLTWIAFASGAPNISIISSDERGRMSYKKSFTVKVDGGELSHVEFSPFNDDEFITSSTLGHVNIFKYTGSFGSTSCIQLSNKVEQVKYNPVAEGIVAAVTSNGCFNVIDYQQKKTIYDLSFSDNVNEAGFLSWHHCGSLAATTTKKGVICIVDPRCSKILHKTDSDLLNCKPIWTADNNYLMTFGTKGQMGRKCYLYDMRNMSVEAQNVEVALGNSILFPTYDPDTGLVVCGSKGEYSAILGEFYEGKFNLLRTDKTTYPFISCSLAPRLAVNVMSCEVVRCYQLSKSEIIPIPYYVARKTYSEFHEDIFPETKARTPSLSVKNWMKSEEPKFQMVSMKPDLKAPDNYYETAAMKHERMMGTNNNTQNIVTSTSDGNLKRTYVQATESYSKFRYIKGDVFHADKDFRNLNKISMTATAESNGFAVSKKNVAVPIEGVSGKLAILNFDKPGRIPVTGSFFVENMSNVSDFEFDRYDQTKLAVGCDNGQINIWKISDEGLVENLKEPTLKLKGHSCKMTVLKYHPSSNGVMSSGDICGSLKIWDVSASVSAFSLQLEEQSSVNAIDWNAIGDTIAVCGANRNMYILDPRTNSIKNSFCYTEGSGPVRVSWIGEKLMFVSTFTNKGEQLLRQFDLRSPQSVLYELKRFSSPAVMIPYYDEDNNLIYVYNKGGLLVVPYEIRNDSNGFFECSSYTSLDYHQAVAFFPKSVCNVKEVEVARFTRLLKASTETVSFKVIRVNTEYFQDDIFPDSRLIASYSMDAKEWISGGCKDRNRISLQPDNMQRYSSISSQLLQKEKKYDSKLELEKASTTSDQQSYDLISSVSEKLQDFDDKPCEQDIMQGISDSEWDD